MKAGSGRDRPARPRRRIGVRAEQQEAMPNSIGPEAARSKARDPTVKSGGAPHLPARVLIELRRGQIPPESFAAVLDAFGELPEAIRGAFNRWRAQTKAKPQVDLNMI